MLAGQGKLNGRPYIGGASFNSSGLPTLAEIRARRTSSAPEIERRPRVGLDKIAAMEAEVEKNRKEAAEATARAQAAEENNMQMHAHMAHQQACLRALMVTMPASALPSLPPVPPLVAPVLLLEHRSFWIPHSFGCSRRWREWWRRSCKPIIGANGLQHPRRVTCGIVNLYNCATHDFLPFSVVCELVPPILDLCCLLMNFWSLFCELLDHVYYILLDVPF